MKKEFFFFWASFLFFFFFSLSYEIIHLQGNLFKWFGSLRMKQQMTSGELFLGPQIRFGPLLWDRQHWKWSITSSKSSIPDSVQIFKDVKVGLGIIWRKQNKTNKNQKNKQHCPNSENKWTSLNYGNFHISFFCQPIHNWC